MGQIVIWTARQRIALVVVIGGVVLVLALRLLTNRSRVSDPQPVDGARSEELPQKIDPNTADWAELATLPGIGKSMAQRIVERRAELQKATPGKPAFECPPDLMRVKGIGPATVKLIEGHLRFPDNRDGRR